MAHKEGVDALDRTLQNIRSSTHVMGGMTVLLAEEFRHKLSVVPRGTHAYEVKACLEASYLWSTILGS